MQFTAGLYIVSTPIGNLNDITIRALDTLKNSDVIFCEDTRISSKLLAKYNINKPLKIYNDNSDAKTRSFISKLILENKIISLISDAGTPMISDPGYKLVKELKEKNLHIDVIPGPCAAIAGLTISGISTDRFLFAGFLPKTEEKKKSFLKDFSNINATLVFYETSNRLLSSLSTILEIIGDREANISRELTKLHQESKTNKISDLISYYSSNPPKGEIIIIVSGKIKLPPSNEEITKELLNLFKDGKTAKTSSEILHKKYKSHFSRKVIYQMANKLKN